ncbi:uncharacterized protein K444DRAFT_631145 [Hyaloscypha bicolor E]|uniref:Uncharacterized protein n=1 Tax=Hyaloscypha bicolor E TaxID=1095630 RepID=A0A2J6T4Z4_9HELO|nr:uncharacterized protein K444DRAFT_631145 [Hyaloscypha bicolor E]PMD58085.1 hypothetical protein K444DRAFT_631145 [Hyaloscypha bicolor E]
MVNPLDLIDIENYSPSHGLSQHDIGVIVGKAPPPAPMSSENTQYDSVLGATKPKKMAAVLETRPLSHLLPLILHFSSVLCPEWPIYVFMSPSVVDMLQNQQCLII